MVSVVVGRTFITKKGDFMEIGAKIRQYRLGKGMTQAVLAQKIGVHLTTIKNWERSVTVPTEAYIQKIAKALDVNPTALLKDVLSQEVDELGDNANGFVRASYLAQQLVGLFAGEDLTTEDKEAVMTILTRAYVRSISDKQTTDTNKGGSIWEV